MSGTRATRGHKRAVLAALGAAGLLLGASSPSWAQEAGPPQDGVQQKAQKLSQPRPGVELETPADADEALKKEIEAFRADLQRYEQELKAYREEVQRIVSGEANQRRKQIEGAYSQEIKNLEASERETRATAIEQFEAFLRKYPNQPRYSPDVMYRLAELYFEKSNDDYLVADEEYQQKLELYEKGRLPDPPTAPTRGYDKTISLFQDLIKRFPDYRFVDGAYYLMGFCLAATEKEQESKLAFEALIREVPASRFVPEAWVRIGEYHFNINELDEAISAYKRALDDPDNAFYDKALYKLAWSYYRADRFDDAIATFKDLVRYADRKRAETGKTGSELREESIQYIAISLSEEDWDGDGSPDADFGMPRVRKYIRGDEPYEQEILVRLGQFLFDNTRYEQSIEVYKLALDKYPLSPDNPKHHDKLILALERQRRFEDAMEERRQIGLYYGPGSQWYKHQQEEGNTEALAFAEGMARNNLIDAAVWNHEQAQKLADEGAQRGDAKLQGDARDRYALAATSYEKYLDRYPDDRESYKWRYYWAECLFYSGQYEKASDAYAQVRELDLGENQFREPSGFNAIKALEQLIAEEIKKGSIPAGVLPGKLAASEEATKGEKEREAPKDIEPKALPELAQKLVVARDRYVELGLVNKRDEQLPGKLEFQSARLFYDFGQLEEARRRFERIIDRYEGQDVSVFAANLMLESYVAAKDYDNMAIWADRISKNPKLANGEKAAQVREEAERLKLGALFKGADELMDAGRYEEAAEKYIQVVNANPQNEYADDALNNSAVAYEKVKRYESAMKLYSRVFQEYPNSPLAPTALFRVAFNAERFFDYDKAVRSYLLLADRYPKSEDREKSLRRAGVILENQQDYEQAARLYIRFSNEYAGSPDAPLALYQAVLVYEKKGDVNSMIQTYNDFRKRFGNDRKYSTEVLEGLDKIATYYWGNKNTKQAASYFEVILKEWKVRGLEPGSPGARFAAKAQFYLTEVKFQEWDQIQLKGPLQTQERALKAKFTGAQTLRPEFEKVYDYKSTEWTMAAGYRGGSILQRFAQSLYDADIPFEEGSEEYYVYQTRLEDIAVPLEDQAVEAYIKVIDKAREEKIVNEWTKKILAELNKYKPDAYPLFHEEKVELTPYALTPAPLSPDALAVPAEEEEPAKDPDGDGGSPDDEDR